MFMSSVRDSCIRSLSENDYVDTTTISFSCGSQRNYMSSGRRPPPPPPRHPLRSHPAHPRTRPPTFTNLSRSAFRIPVLYGN
jgi:hypothetical protein